MTFYTDPAFFMLLALLVVPAVICGLREKPLRGFGFIVSLVFIIALFSKDLPGLAAFVFYLALSSATTWGYLRLLRKARRGQKPPPRFAYPLALLLVLAPLVIYKTGVAFDATLLGFIGISYITFKTLQVIIEIRDGLIEAMKPLDYLFFLVFFPSFSSGPILRSRSFVEDISRPIPAKEYRELLVRAAYRFLIGAFYKIVCSSVFSIAIWFIPRALGQNSPWMALLGQIGSAWAYGFYLFFDFAGYSLMAMGVAGAFGVRVPYNFRAPFRSLDIKDFWNRWHITLSFWLRDFVFMRLVRLIRKRKLISSRLTTSCLGFIANMGLMGLWHGLTIPYVCYGLYHGLLLAGNEIFQKSGFYKRNKDRKAYKMVSWFVTFNLVMLGFALFSGQIIPG